MRTVNARLAAELTPRQYEVWLLRTHGRSFQQIADILSTPEQPLTKQGAHGVHARATKTARIIVEQERARDRSPE